MKITIFGTGYVGLVTGVCLADIGHDVICVDVDIDKIKCLKAGKAPIYEPGLSELLTKNIKAKRINFTADAKHGAEHGEVQFIAVGTPAADDGAADLRYVREVAITIGKYLKHACVIVNKSTVPVGTVDEVKNIIQDELNKRKTEVNFTMASNPEFLKQGDAINDFMRAPRIVVGAQDEKTIATMRQLYNPIINAGQKFIAMDVNSAELTKYAANAFLSTKISFMNEMSHLAKNMGADIEKIRAGIGSDPRIGSAFLRAGCGYGGSCFPKDVKALIKMADVYASEVPILTAVDNTNHRQKVILFSNLKKYFAGKLHGKTIALWGLAFKPHTNDMREAPSKVLLELLWQAGSKVQAYDPAALNEARRIYGERDDLLLCTSAKQALKNADALVIVTEWEEFSMPDFDLIKSQLKTPVIFDGRNLFEPEQMQQLGFDYYCIGRGKTVI